LERLFAVIAFIAVLAGCATYSDPATIELQVSVDSFNDDTGAFAVRLENSSPRSIFVVHPVATFSPISAPKVVPLPNFSDTLMYHNNWLKPGESLKFEGTCLKDGTCTEYVGFYVCWYNDDWNCPKYLLTWSDKPINAT
jgi:hypothetical protein